MVNWERSRVRDMGGEAKDQQSPLLRRCSSPEEPLERTGNYTWKLKPIFFFLLNNTLFQSKQSFNKHAAFAANFILEPITTTYSLQTKGIAAKLQPH